MNKKISLMCLILIITMPPLADSATKTQINSLNIIQSVQSPTCTEYKIAGKCFWLFCTYGGCKVRSSVKVKHYIPDVVISAYSQPFQNPWTEANTITSLSSSLVGSEVQGGGDTNNRQANNRTKIRFKDVQAIGHPGGSLYSEMLSGMGYYCKNGVTAMYPYYISELDFLSWRNVLIESVYPEAMIPGMREIGNQLSGNMWGNIYPRSGAVTQNDDFKAAAVAVQRGADILTNNISFHISQNYTKSKSQGFWPPTPVRENTKNHKWQLLAPKMNMTCKTFPTLNDLASFDGGYVFALWRPYQCCKRRGQTFLYSIDYGG